MVCERKHATGRPNQAVLDLHYLDEVHLFALWRDPGVLPRRAPAVGEKAGAVIGPQLRSARYYLGRPPSVELLASKWPIRHNNSTFGVRVRGAARRAWRTSPPAGCGPRCGGQRRTSVPCDARDIVSWINHFVRAGRRDGMNAKLSKLTPVLFAGVAAAGIAVAPSAFADPEPPPPAPPAPGCYNPDGTPCTPSAGPQGAGAEIPGGPGALARSDGHVSAGIPGGPWAKAGPGGGIACVPGGPCRTITLPG